MLIPLHPPRSLSCVLSRSSLPDPLSRVTFSCAPSTTTKAHSEASSAGAPAYTAVRRWRSTWAAALNDQGGGCLPPHACGIVRRSDHGALFHTRRASYFAPRHPPSFTKRTIPSFGMMRHAINRHWLDAALEGTGKLVICLRSDGCR
jgi:hypothetical protein